MRSGFFVLYLIYQIQVAHSKKVLYICISHKIKLMHEIEICRNCGGKEVVDDYDKRIGRDEYEDMTCPRCNGTGRTITEAVGLSISIPYGTSKKILYDFSREMHDVQRKFEKLVEEQNKLLTK